MCYNKKGKVLLIYRWSKSMAKNETILKVFIASPGDLKPERKVILDVIEEINRIWSKTQNIRLVPLTWENDSYPDIGEYTQDVINKQVLIDYDFFIGILWSRFGTPTKKAKSGTEEEFVQAFEKYLKNPKLLKIMLYFKKKKIASINKIPEQINLINEFKEKIKNTNRFLYWNFNDTEEFKTIVRRHLEQHLIGWGRTWGNFLKDEQSNTKKILGEKIENEIYFTEEDDFFEIYEKSISESKKIKSSLLKITEKILSNIPIQKSENMDMIRIAIESELFSIQKSAEIYLDGFKYATIFIDKLNIPSTTLIDQSFETISNLKSSFEKLIPKVGIVIKNYSNYGGNQVNYTFRKSRKEFIFVLKKFKKMLENIVENSSNFERILRG